jgi:hypothetical protein
MWDIEGEKESETQFDFQPTTKVSLKSERPACYQTDIRESKRRSNEYRLAA